VLVKVIENNFWYLSPFDFNHHPDSLPVRFITDIGYPFNLFGIDQLGNIFEKPGFVNSIRNLGNNYFVLLAFFSTFDSAFGSQVNNPLTFHISPADILTVKNITTCGEIRPWNKFHNIIHCRLRMIDQINQPITDLNQIVRRNITGHADCDSRRTVDQKVRKLGWQDLRHQQALIIVRNKIDGVFINVSQEFFGQTRHSDFGITHGRRWVTIDRTKITLTVNQWIAKAEVLSHSDQSIINRSISMWVIFTNDIADNAG